MRFDSVIVDAGFSGCILAERPGTQLDMKFLVAGALENLQVLQYGPGGRCRFDTVRGNCRNRQ